MVQVLAQMKYIKNKHIYLEKHSNSEFAKNMVYLEKEEIKIYKKYKDFFSYGFYIAKKI